MTRTNYLTLKHPPFCDTAGYASEIPVVLTSALCSTRNFRDVRDVRGNAQVTLPAGTEINLHPCYLAKAGMAEHGAAVSFTRRVAGEARAYTVTAYTLSEACTGAHSEWPAKPLALSDGDTVYIDVNQAEREATVLAVVDDIALIEYEMPRGSTALTLVSLYNIYKTGRVRANWATKSVSYWTVPMVYVAAMRKAETWWFGNPQGGSSIVAGSLKTYDEYVAARKRRSQSKATAAATRRAEQANARENLERLGYKFERRIKEDGKHSETEVKMTTPDGKTSPYNGGCYPDMQTALYWAASHVRTGQLW